MKHLKYSLMVLWFCLSCSNFVHAQDYYVKPHISIFVPLIKNNVPSYKDNNVGNESVLDLRNDQEGMETIPKGYSFGISVGRTLKNALNTEVNVNYTRYKFTTYYGNWYTDYTSNWDIQSINIAPALLWGESWNRFMLSAKLGGTIGFSTLIINDEPYTFDLATVPASELTSKPFISYGYFFGLECSYKISNTIHVSANCTFDNSYFKPKHASYNYYFENIDVEYKNSFINSSSLGDKDLLSKTLKLTSLKLEIGIKYIIGKSSDQNPNK